MSDTLPAIIYFPSHGIAKDAVDAIAAKTSKGADVKHNGTLDTYTIFAEVSETAPENTLWQVQGDIVAADCDRPIEMRVVGRHEIPDTTYYYAPSCHPREFVSVEHDREGERVVSVHEVAHVVKTSKAVDLARDIMLLTGEAHEQAMLDDIRKHWD